MLDRLRTPFFVIALILLALVVFIELGSLAYLDAVPMDKVGAPAGSLPTPGLGIPYLALLDGLLLFTVMLMALPLLIPERVHGRVQGIATLIVSFLVLLGAILMIIAAVTMLVLMVSLLLAIPFGTLVYLGKYADFSVGAAQATLASIMTLKLGFVVALVLAHQRFLENKGLIMIALSSLLANLVIAFLQGLVPRFLVSITDDIAAIIVAVIAAIWGLVFFVGSIPAIVKALRVDRALAR